MHAYEQKFHIAMCCFPLSQQLTCQRIQNYWSQVVSSICKALRKSMCPPLLRAHYPPQAVWQSNMNGPAVSRFLTGPPHIAHLVC